MQKAKAKSADDDMRAEYDFSAAVRGKYYERYQASTNVVVLDPDVSKVFPNAEAVNQALRVLASVARARVPVPKRRSKAKKPPQRGLSRAG
jgi:aminoglycoside phosphotransferase (APT) family kinase protein